jgi:hypothetical protein
MCCNVVGSDDRSRCPWANSGGGTEHSDHPDQGRLGAVYAGTGRMEGTASAQKLAGTCTGACPRGTDRHGTALTLSVRPPARLADWQPTATIDTRDRAPRQDYFFPHLPDGIEKAPRSIPAYAIPRSLETNPRLEGKLFIGCLARTHICPEPSAAVCLRSALLSKGPLGRGRRRTAPGCWGLLTGAFKKRGPYPCAPQRPMHVC